MHVDAHWQIGGQFAHARVQCLAEFLDVAALLHRNGQANGRRAIEAKHRGRGVDITAADVSDVGQSIKTIIEPQIDVGQVLFRLELPGGAYGNPLRPGVDHPGGGHSVLRLQALHHLALINAQRGELAGRKIQVQDFILLAHHLDFAQTGYLTDLGTHLLHIIAQLTHRKSVAGEGID